jgi:site-specific DNA-methyltransferase (adenine-specific)
MKFPNNKQYKIIYSDPAWSYKDKALAGKRGASSKYPTMKPDEIKKLPVQNIADENSFLFLWATFPQLQVALDVMKSWGFEYKTVAFTWIKKNKNGTNFIGMGSYSRANAEICLLGKKGKPKVISHSVRQVIESIPEQHSKKPDEVRERIVELCGDIPRIELFATKRCKNWDSWGNAIKQ